MRVDWFGYLILKRKLNQLEMKRSLSSCCEWSIFNQREAPANYYYWGALTRALQLAKISGPRPVAEPGFFY